MAIALCRARTYREMFQLLHAMCGLYTLCFWLKRHARGMRPEARLAQISGWGGWDVQTPYSGMPSLHAASVTFSAAFAARHGSGADPLTSIPLLLAVLCYRQRVSDLKHTIGQVLGGSMVGLLWWHCACMATNMAACRHRLRGS